VAAVCVKRSPRWLSGAVDAVGGVGLPSSTLVCERLRLATLPVSVAFAASPFFVRRSWKKQSLCSRRHRRQGGSEGFPGSPRSHLTFRLRHGTHA